MEYTALDTSFGSDINPVRLKSPTLMSHSRKRNIPMANKKIPLFGGE